MTKLFLFCDESGTMPANDNDGPFCAATIAISERPPTLANRSGHIGDLADVFDEVKCVPQVVFVRPGKGYGDLLRHKTSKINTMARATRLIIGSNEYLPNNGHNPRNTVWIRCMGVCLVRAVAWAAKLGPISAVSVILDRKSMAEASRRLFVDRVRSLAMDIKGPGEYVKLGKQSSSCSGEFIRFGRDDVSVFWSDEVSLPEFEGGLFLAHCLSGLAKTALESATEAKLAAISR